MFFLLCNDFNHVTYISNHLSYKESQYNNFCGYRNPNKKTNIVIRETSIVSATFKRDCWKSLNKKQPSRIRMKRKL